MANYIVNISVDNYVKVRADDKESAIRTAIAKLEAIDDWFEDIRTIEVNQVIFDDLPEE